MEEYALRAYRIAFAILRSPDDAEDVVQEAFITVYRKLGKLRKESSFNSWLSQIVASGAHDLQRRRKREKKTLQSQKTMFESGQVSFPDDPVTEAEGMSFELHQAIGKLPEQHRLVILLRYAEDDSIEEIARILKRPAGTIRRMLSEAYKMLRLYLEEEESL